MKTFLRVGLPILLVAGLVFGVTFIRLYSPDDPPEPAGPAEAKDRGPRKAAPAEVLKFPLTTAATPAGEPRPELRFMTYWDAAVEVGAPGHFEFWCQNRQPEPVSVRVPSTSCQCAGVELANVPADAFADYLVGSALAGGPLCPAAGPVGAAVHAAFDRRLSWVPLYDKEHKDLTQTIPAAGSSAGPQLSLVRLGWSGKGDVGPKELSAAFVATLGNATPFVVQLVAKPTVVPAFSLLRRDGPSAWGPVRELDVGEMRENGAARQVIYLVSATRPFPVYTVTPDRADDPCVTWTEPAPATDADWADFLVDAEGGPRRARSLYKMEVTVRERVEVEEGGKKVLRQLDLGPIDRRLTVAGAEAGTVPVAVRGRVLGSVTVQGGNDGRIDLGNSFPADEDRTKAVVLQADTPELDLTLVDAETAPNYLRVKLEPLAPLPDGRKQWRLRVTVPKRTLYGALPETSVVVLKTNAPTGRRLRIPVRGMTFDSGGPRL